MKAALTGTPGVGKSTIALLLQQEGWAVLEVGDLARKEGLLLELDAERDSYDVDLDGLDEITCAMPGDVVLVGHLSHLLQVDLVIVLRCQPRVLVERLQVRHYSADKVAENVEAEALDVILVESIESGAEVCEVDTTARTPEEAASSVLEILRGERRKYLPGHLDWSQEALGWD
jgi:adenylate kinase